MSLNFVDVGPTEFDGHEASTTIRVGDESFRIPLRTRTRVGRPLNFGDVWLPIALFPSMRLGLELRFSDTLSPRLLRNVPIIQGLLSDWFPDLSPVRVTAQTRTARFRRRDARTMQTFTGGADSFFTMSRNDDVSALVYLHDDVHDNNTVRSNVSALLQSMARSARKDLIEVDSGVRTMLDRYGDWGTQTHGGVLAAVGALCSREGSRMLIPASFTYSELFPWGSHPLLDHLWSGDALDVVHEGAHASRFEKISSIASNRLVLRSLRVCWKTRSELNCSKCEKCLRTMCSLEILGVLDDAETFRGAIDLAALRRAHISSESELKFAADNERAARRSGRMDIADAIAESIARSSR